MNNEQSLGFNSEKLDPGIRDIVVLLRENGFHTFESCEGGEGHCFQNPTVRFQGDHSEGFRAIALLQQLGLGPHQVSRYWTVIDGEPTGPDWELTFIFPQH